MTESQLTASNRVRNILIALAAIALSISIFLGLQTETASVTLDTQAEQSLPLDVAFSNDKPTFIEFYADWCTSCQAMAKDLAEIKHKYIDSVNFVMLNVDNTKWLPEILRYRVDGIPHFVFLNGEEKTVAQAIGEQPRSILEADLDALTANLPIPYSYSTGQISNLNSPVTKSNSDDPRSHSQQSVVRSQ